MKSREEYQASIFAKRDALLKKRRNNFTKVFTGTAAAVILAVSVIAVPKLTEKQTLSSDITLPSSGNTTAASAAKSETLAYYLTGSEESETAKSHTDTAEAVTENEVIYYFTDETTAANATMQKSPDTDSEEIDFVPTIESIPASVNDNSAPDAEDEHYAGEIYLYDGIAAAAFNALSQEQQSECIDRTEPEIISSVSASESFYLVTFRTESEKSYQVKLLRSTLEPVEINISSEKEHRSSNEFFTHKPGYKGGSQ